MATEDIKQKWLKDQPLYEDLGKLVSIHLKHGLPKYEILPEISYRTKELLSIVKKIERKKKEKESSYTYDDLKDKLGVRVICSFSSDLEIVDKFLKEQYLIIKAEYKKDSLAFDKLDYTSNHYDIKINPKKLHLDFYESIKDFIFEIQVRSINQHAWSSSAHILTYKSEVKIPQPLQRRVYRLLSLYEIADDEFSSVNQLLKDSLNNLIYKFIRLLEGKVYKYAKVDFDRATSIYNFEKLLADFPENKKEYIFEKIEEFIKINDEKIKRIFEENEIRYHLIPLLTQPEIFLIFYMLENHEALLEKTFSNDLEYNELETIMGIWV
ncbi:hypothetical protein A7A78_02905 [Aequorivita soesokkakensis]|jgi:ppGpp synthetase/RelA/SpoT-type nucleotidyltranferase|uniref:RelA/SpoT domain-containing protein n=1 Tax=Aequorivita soesokkakensis TaxID=1385699 RepID=A0A1A9LFC6_9FLAO|nr:hypothetical protein [Aequorivita soesokkakensis]OAD91461.1 hypothetical protein A7A78_02905 [Aequorivita soesokkakensis]